MQMREIENAWDKGSIYRLERGLVMWHLCGIHIGATRETCKQAMQVVNIQSFLTHVWEDLKRGVGDKVVRGVEGTRGVKSVSGLHTCVRTHLG